MINKIGKARNDMTKDEFLFWLRQVRRKSFDEVVTEISDFYSKAHDVEKRMIESVLLTDICEELSREEN